MPANKTNVQSFQAIPKFLAIKQSSLKDKKAICKTMNLITYKLFFQETWVRPFKP